MLLAPADIREPCNRLREFISALPDDDAENKSVLIAVIDLIEIAIVDLHRIAAALEMLTGSRTHG